MFCKNCGFPLDDAAVFCSKCGTPVNSETKNSNTPIITQQPTGLYNTEQSNTNSFNYNQQNFDPYNGFQPNQFSNYSQRPAVPKRINQNTIIMSALAIVLLAGLIFGAYMLFFRGNSSSTAPTNIENTPISKNIKDVIIGTWDVYDKGNNKLEGTFKFEKNGKCSITEGTRSNNANYTIEGPDEDNYSRIKVVGGRTYTVKIINNDKLGLIDGYYFIRRK